MTTLAQGMISISSEMEGYTASLTNDSISIATDKDGNNPVLNGASTTATLALGATTVQAYIPTTIGGFSCSGCTISVSGTTISLVTVTADTGYVDIPIYSNSARTSEYLVVTKRFSFSKSKQGNTGAQGLQGLQGPRGDQGIKGNPGANGVSSYTHIAYSTSPTGATGFSTSNSSGATYIGMYVDTVATDSLSPSKYKWTLIKGADGTQGIQGPTGPNGKTSYLHIAYATNSTGTTGFSTTDSVGKTYIGQYTDFVAADSTIASTYSWTLIKGTDGTNGINALTGFLTNESSTIPTDKDGNSGVFTTAITTMKVYNGITDDSANWSYSASPSAGVTGSLSTATYTVTAMTQDSGYVDITASRSGYANIIKRFTITKNKAGLTGGVGASATSYWLVTSTPVIAKTIAEIYSPSTITITGKSQVGTNSPTDYKGRFVISDSIDGSTFVNRYTSSANESTKTYTPLPGIKSLKIKFYLAGGTTILLDEQTIQVVADPSDLSIGGRNLVLNSNFEKTMTDHINTQNATISLSTDYYYQGSQSLKILLTGPSGGGIFFPITGDYLNMCKGKVTTYSLKAKGIGSSIGKTMNATIINSDGSKTRSELTLTDDWQTVSVTGMVPNDVTSVNLFAGYGELTSGDIIYIDCVKYELGNKATDWTPAPEDTDIAIENAINNIQVGGRNLVLGSGNYLPNKTDTWIIDDARHWSKNLFNGYIRFTKLTTTAFSRIKIPLSMTLEASTTYTATIKFRRSIASNTIVYIANLSSSSGLESIINATPSTANEFTTVTRTFTTSIANTNCLMLTSTNFTRAGETFDIEYIKIEKGNKPTDWTPAPEDEGVAIDNAIGNIQVGGRNYARYSGGSYLSREGIHLGDRYRASITNVDGKACLQILNNASTPAIRFLQIPIPEKAVYTFSIWIKGTTNHSAKIFQWATTNYDTRTFNVTDSWAKYSFTFTALTPSDTVHLLDFPETTYISDWKFELGNKATDWSPAPEDVQTSIDKAQQSADGKNLVFYQATAPSTTERVIGDTWFDTDDGNKIYRWNGTEWAATQFGTNAIANSSITNALIADATISSAKISALDAGKITTGYLSANRISGGTLSLGGGSNGNGVLSIKDSSGVEVVKGDNSGLLVDGGSYRIKDEFGNVCNALNSSNLITNGGFELYFNGNLDGDNHYLSTEVEGWGDPIGTFRIANIGSYSGLPEICRYDGETSATMTNNGSISQPFAAFAGTTYTVSFCTRLNPVKSSGVSSGNVKVSLFKYHSSGTTEATASYTKTFTIGQAWTRCIYTFVASDLSNGLSLDALILHLTSTTTAWVMIDCVQVVEGSLPCLIETASPGNLIHPGRISLRSDIGNGNYFMQGVGAPWKIYTVYKYVSNGAWTLVDYSDLYFGTAQRVFTTTFRGLNAQALVNNDTLTSCYVALPGTTSGYVYVMVIGY